MSTYVRSTDAERDRQETELFWFRLRYRIRTIRATDFVYAFERGHSMSPSTEIPRSQALIEKEDGGGSTDGLSWRERLEKSQEETYPSGGATTSHAGLRLEFERDAIAERLERVTHPTASWPQLLTSLEQALDRLFRLSSSVTGPTIESRRRSPKTQLKYTLWTVARVATVSAGTSMRALTKSRTTSSMSVIVSDASTTVTSVCCSADAEPLSRK